MTRAWLISIKNMWLEILLIIFLLAVVIISVRGSAKTIKIDYGKHLTESSAKLGNLPIEEYLDKIRKMDCTVIIAIKDNQGYYIDPAIIEKLRAFGFEDLDELLDEHYHSFIGVYDSGGKIYSKVGGDEAITYSLFLNNHYFYVKSATYHNGNTADIYIDDVSYSVNNRGLNIVVVDRMTDELIDSVTYDLYLFERPVYRLVDGIITKCADTREDIYE